jgi:hypothetical protein
VTLVLIGDTHPALVVDREAEGVARQEAVLRDMLFANPAMLPVREIDPSFGRLVPVAKEFHIPGGVGRIDALFIDEHGRLVIVECKLWRNPQAKREVVGQILHYASEMARFSYDVLQRQVSQATGRPGNVLHSLLTEAGIEIDEARLVDQISNDLRRGRFLLLIVGDGMRAGTNSIGEFLNEHGGLAFDFAMIEMAQYRFHDPLLGIERTIVQPRIATKTELIERFVIRNEAVGITIQPIAHQQAAPSSSGGPPSDAQAQWQDFVRRFIAQMQFDDPSQPAPQSGGLNWMRLPLPGPSHLTLWRSKADEVGAFVRYRGSEGLAVFEDLLEQRDIIDQEFEDVGLPRPVWDSEGAEPSIALGWPSPQPWGSEEEDRQITLLSQAANQFVNSLRSRLAQHRA